ncbi:hypothetical protein ACHAWF_013615, partial [Thalassiosira exigua]
SLLGCVEELKRITGTVGIPLQNWTVPSKSCALRQIPSGQFGESDAISRVHSFGRSLPHKVCGRKAVERVRDLATSSNLFYCIHEANNGATQFAIDLEAAIDAGFFYPGDILVLDRAAYHTGGENTMLEKMALDSA